MTTTVFQRCTHMFTSLAVLALAACGGVGSKTGDDVGPDAGSTPDTTAPTVVSMSPSDGATGVAAGAVLKIVFSEPMDQASVENALSSSPLDPGDAMLSWNAAGDTLSITPNQPLLRGEGVGADPGSVMPIAYELKVGTGATDVAGNHLAAEAAVAFTTEKKMSLTIPPVDAMTRTMNNSGGIAAEASNLILGDGAAADFYTRTLLTFDLAPLPGSLIAIESASLGARQLAPVGTPYTDLGALTVDHLLFTTIDAAAFDAAALASMGSLSTNPTLETKSADVTAAVIDDYASFAARDGHSQFRLRFAQNTDGQGDADIAQFAYATIGLVVIYTAP